MLRVVFGRQSRILKSSRLGSFFCTKVGNNDSIADESNTMAESESDANYSDQQSTYQEIGSNSSVKEIRNIIKEGKEVRYKGKYHNLLCLYRALKKQTSLSASPPHHKSKADLYKFLLQRKIIQRDTLNKLQVEIERTNVKAEAKLKDVIGSAKAITFPKLPLDMQMDPHLVGLDNYGSGFTSFHFLLAYRSCYQRKVYVKELGKDAYLEIGFGVFPPTRKDYIRLFDSVFKQWCLDNRRSIHQKTFPLSILDVGCGSGVLGFLTLKNLMGVFNPPTLRAYLLGVDQYHEAVRCSTNNAASLNLDSNCYFIQSSELFPSDDAVGENPNSVRKVPPGRFTNAVKKNEYDFIICNPPWLPSDLDNSQEKGEIVSFSDSYVFDDQKKGFLEKFFANAARHLKNEGRIFLVHSTLGSLLGLYAEDYIPQLCESNHLQVRQIFETGARVKFTESDWFAKEKAASSVLLYEISHPFNEIEKQFETKFEKQ